MSRRLSWALYLLAAVAAGISLGVAGAASWPLLVRAAAAATVAGVLAFVVPEGEPS